MRISDWSSDVCSSDLGSTICPITARGNKARICTKRAEIRNLSNAEAVICAITEKRWRAEIRWNGAAIRLGSLATADRKSGGRGKRVSESVDVGSAWIIKNKQLNNLRSW